MTVPVPPLLDGVAETRLRPGLLVRVAVVIGILAVLNVVTVPLALWVERPDRVTVHVEQCHKPLKGGRRCDVTVTDRGRQFHTVIESDLPPGATVPGWSTRLMGVTTTRLVTYADPALTIVIVNILALVCLALLRVAVISARSSAAWHRLFHRQRDPGQT